MIGDCAVTLLTFTAQHRPLLQVKEQEDASSQGSYSSSSWCDPLFTEFPRLLTEAMHSPRGWRQLEAGICSAGEGTAVTHGGALALTRLRRLGRRVLLWEGCSGKSQG